jgi:hypothetical protein
MNQKKARAIRRKVYGDQSRHQIVKYVRGKSGGLIATGLRAEYKQAKKEAKS